jgi:hypothetical protein
MAWFGAAYATQDGYQSRPTFSDTEAQAAQSLNQGIGGQQNAALAGQQVQQNAQSNALGLAASQRGGRGNAMARSAMMQAPQARQAGLQAQYQAQQSNFRNASQAQDFEAQRRSVIEQEQLGLYQKDNNDALRQMRSTNNDIAAVNGIIGAVTGSTGGGGGKAMSDSRTKNVLGKRGKDSPQVVIMIGAGDHEMGWDDDDDEDDDAGDDAVNAMRELEPAQFEYKDEFKGAPGAGSGEYTGIMAQDLEKTPAGRGTVAMGPDGMRRVDGAKLSTLNSAALSRLVKDVDKLKGAKRGG